MFALALKYFDLKNEVSNRLLDGYEDFFFFKDFIYLTETARAGTQAGGVGEGEAGFPLSREPDVGLNLSRRQMLND